MSAPAVEAGRTDETSGAVRLSVLPLLRRLHFYAGVLVGPFLVVAAARGAGLDGSLELTAPDPGSAWTAAQVDNTWSVRLDKAAIDPAGTTVTARADFADRPFLAKLSSLGIQAHRGRLFAVANQIVLFLLAAAILSLIVLGYRMWWQRRPTRVDRRARLGAPPKWAT